MRQLAARWNLPRTLSVLEQRLGALEEAARKPPPSEWGRLCRGCGCRFDAPACPFCGCSP